MKPIVEILDAAEREVLAHTIESTRGLRAFFCQHGGEEVLSALQVEAVRRGLYRYMGQRYAEAVEALLERTRQCIAFGRIRTEDQLKRYLVEACESRSCPTVTSTGLSTISSSTHDRPAFTRFSRALPPRTCSHHGSPYDRDPAMQHRIRSGTEA